MEIKDVDQCQNGDDTLKMLYDIGVRGAEAAGFERGYKSPFTIAIQLLSKMNS